MSTMNVREYERLAVEGSSQFAPAGAEPAVAGENVSYTTTTAGTAFTSTTRFVRVYVDADSYIDFGSAPTAAAGGCFLPAGSVEYFGVQPGHKVAAVQA